MTRTVIECDACGKGSTYDRKLLQQSGWTWNNAGLGRWFVMCGACVEWYARRRQEKAAA